MQPAPAIGRGTHDQLETLADVLADSFSTDPVMNWVIPARDLYAGFFRLLLRDVFLPRGMVHLESEGRGAGLWLPPGESFDMRPSPGLISLVTQLVLRKGPRPLLRIPQQAALFDRHHPTEPHFHLLFVGCRQANQGQGVGSALIKHGTRVADEQHMPAYLESSNELNVPLYQRHGFEVISQEALPGDGPRVWFMWRDAR